MLYPNKYAALSVLASALALPVADAKAVFCHYMVGGVSAQHAATDIDTASKMGCDAFALDITNPSESWALTALEGLFNHAATTDLRLFFSLDTAAVPNIHDNDNLLKTYLGHAAYYKYDNRPLLSTFNGGKIATTDWSSFLSSHGGNFYFLPNFGDHDDYTTNPSEFMATYDPLINGTFSWETAWPAPGTSGPITTDIDQQILKAAHASDKTYMAPLSTLQFKDLAQYGTYYRVGGVTLPHRMAEILAMPVQPDFVELISWNDAGESHYIGDVWPETLPPSYSNPSQWSHAGWRPLVASFIAAYKDGCTSATKMKPAGGAPEGAMWYHTVCTGASCNKPSGGEVDVDNVNYAVILPAGVEGYSVRITSGGKVIKTVPAKAGLNYMSVLGLQPGKQTMDLLDSNGVCMTATGTLEVAQDAQGTCNYNYQVAALAAPGALKAPTPASARRLQ